MATINILAMDTSASRCLIGLSKNGQNYCREIASPMQQSRLILSTIQEVLDQASLTLAELNVIAYGAGPGSFTGTRISNMVAQGIAYAHDLPLIRLSSLAILAQAAVAKYPHANYLLARDARMNAVYWAEYKADQEGVVGLIGKEVLVAPDKIKINLDSAKLYVGLGDGWPEYDQNLNSILPLANIDMSIEPTASAMLTLATKLWIKQEFISPLDAMPVYFHSY